MASTSGSAPRRVARKVATPSTVKPVPAKKLAVAEKHMG